MGHKVEVMVHGQYFVGFLSIPSAASSKYTLEHKTKKCPQPFTNWNMLKNFFGKWYLTNKKVNLNCNSNLKASEGWSIHDINENNFEFQGTF